MMYYFRAKMKSVKENKISLFMLNIKLISSLYELSKWYIASEHALISFLII